MPGIAQRQVAAAVAALQPGSKGLTDYRWVLSSAQDPRRGAEDCAEDQYVCTDARTGPPGRKPGNSCMHMSVVLSPARAPLRRAFASALMERGVSHPRLLHSAPASGFSGRSGAAGGSSGGGGLLARFGEGGSLTHPVRPRHVCCVSSVDRERAV